MMLWSILMLNIGAVVGFVIASLCHAAKGN